MSKPDLEDKDKKNSREIKSLKLKEVSLVDRPAILREFLVIKRQMEDNGMSVFIQDPSADEVVEKMDWRDYEDVEKALPAALKTAIGDVVKFLKAQSGMQGAPKDAIGMVTAFLGKVAGGQYPYPAAKVEDKKKADGEEENKVEGEGESKPESEPQKPEDEPKSDPPAEQKDDESNAEPAAKASDSSELSIKISADGEVSISGQPVNKAGKAQFTGNRTTALQSSVKQLLDMLADVDSNAAKGIIGELAKSKLAGEIKWRDEGVSKSVGEMLEDTLKPIQTGIESLAKRLEVIEKSRPAPKSEPGESDNEPVSKSDSPWKGLPL